MPRKGAFKRCVESVSSRGGVSDPRAVCAKSIARKRGRTRGRVNAAQSKLFPFVSKRAARKRASSQAKRMAYKSHGGESEKHYRAISDLIASGMSRSDAMRLMGNPGEKLSAKERALLGAVRDAAVAKAAPVALLLNKRKRKNPGRTAEEAYADFHGRDAREIIDFDVPLGSKASMLPRKTSGVGDLIELDIRVPRDRHVSGAQYVTLAKFGKCWLTEHPRMKQLYVEGGDQSVDLEQFGLDESDPHEWEYLGELVRCLYFTTKDHLGKDGGTANYHHRFGKNELTLKKTELIKVAYHVPDEQLWFIGGGYEIPSEGIDG